MSPRIRRPLYLATRNRHKIAELTAMLPEGAPWELRPATDLSADITWDETGATFVENARIKALALRRFTDAAVLGDDSGLEVHALGGAPGVFSSRYAGVDGDDAANNAKLLRELGALPADQRQARFVCCLVLIDEDGQEQVFEGFVPGTILTAPRGGAGFGYDPLFQETESGLTMAEMTSHQKNSLSHRHRAFQQWIKTWSLSS